MKQLAYVFSAGLLVSMAALACDSSSSSGGTGTFAGNGGAAGSGTAGTTSEAGAGGSGTAGSGTAGSGTAGSATAGSNAGGSDPFGGGGSGTAGSGTAGSGTAGSGTAGSGTAGSDPGQDCQTCATTSCANELGTCQNNPDCAAIFNCFGQCADGDTACLQKCVTDNPNGSNDFNAVQGCLQQNCQEACGGGGGGGDACAQCQQAQCSAEVQACLDDAACSALNQCLVTNNCTDQACFNDCVQQNPGGEAKFNAAGMCVQQNCAAECQ